MQTLCTSLIEVTAVRESSTMCAQGCTALTSSIARDSATFKRRLAMFGTLGHEYTAEEVDNLARERAEFAIIIAFQSESKRGGWVFDLRFAAETCKAIWFEEAVWRSISRMRRGPLERTHLMYAAYIGNVARVNWLIARGAQVHETDAVADAADGGSHTALHWAVMCPQFSEGHADVVRALIDAGADINVTTFKDFGPRSQRRRRAAYTPLLIAVEQGHVDAARLLLSLGCEKDISSDGWSPAHHAARTDHVDMLQVLLEFGADLDGLTVASWRFGGGRPLHIASTSGSIKAMKFLVDVAGVNVNGLSHDGRTPLHFAVGPHYCSSEREQNICHCRAAMKMLLDNGADINAQTPFLAARGTFGETPLHEAVYHSCLKSVVFLVAAGASCQLTNSRGRTPLFSLSRKLRVRVDEMLEGIPRAA